MNLFPERIVHFDLKGAAPRVGYFLELLPLLKQLGATGLLIEWEDTFPYSGELSVLARPNAYSPEDVRFIVGRAKELSLKVIPLVQTFGHLEFVLKHQKFAHLCEVPGKPGSICPKHNDTMPLLHEVVRQIVALHEGIDTIHIGADEAYFVGKCDNCKGSSKDRITIFHLARVARMVKENFRLQVLAWNDMFAETDAKSLAQYRLQDLVEPVIWGYANNLEKSGYFPKGLFQRTGQVFDRVWVASAFKGAKQRDEIFCDIQPYLQNNLAWVGLMTKLANSKEVRDLRGIILTGWQRFEHFSPLCEVLPIGLPSLAICLLTIQQGFYDRNVYAAALKILRCADADKLDYSQLPDDHLKFTNIWSTGNFPGVKAFDLCEQLRQARDDLTQLSRSSIKTSLSAHTARLIGLGTQLREELKLIFNDDAVDEWLYQNVQLLIDNLKDNSTELRVKIRQDSLTSPKFDV